MAYPDDPRVHHGAVVGAVAHQIDRVVPGELPQLSHQRRRTLEYRLHERGVRSAEIRRL